MRKIFDFFLNKYKQDILNDFQAKLQDERDLYLRIIATIYRLAQDIDLRTIYKDNPIMLHNVFLAENIFMNNYMILPDGEFKKYLGMITRGDNEISCKTESK